MQEQDFLKQIQDQFDRLQKMYDMNSEEFDDDSITSALQDNMDEINEQMWVLSKTKVLKYKKIHPYAVDPKYNFPSDSGFDLHSTENITIPPFGRVLVPTGLVLQFEEGLELQVRPKSGLAIKQGLTVLNTPGTVDQGYNGEIQVIVFNTNDYPVNINQGMKVAQGVLCPVYNGKFVKTELTENINDTDRGDKGFGSTGI